ncbi:MAG TPA: hypothetical protein VNO21_02495, partial [Polyangiaceae bacterium]|nr:hypothetical protein [Polyangiaceae bacterium]
MGRVRAGILAGAAVAGMLGGCQAHDASKAPAATAPTKVTAGTGRDASNTTALEPPTLRLPDTVRPTHYDVALTVVPTADRFEGHMTMSLDVRAPSAHSEHAELSKPSDTIWLNATKLDVRAARIDGVAAKVVPGGGGDGFIGIQSAQPLPAGRATLVLDYTGEISSKEQTNLFKQKDGDHWYAFTDFEPIGARHVFPCFDEPSFKVPWKLQVKVRAGDRALSNAPQTSESIEGGYKIVQFAETKPLPSYLMAFAVGPFDAIDAGAAGANHTPVRIIVPHGRGAEARYAKEVTPGILNRLEDYFGIPYPY